MAPGCRAEQRSFPPNSYCLDEIIIRDRHATALPSLNAGMNFHPLAARTNDASTAVFPVESTDLTFPAESMTRIKADSVCEESVSGRVSMMGCGEVTSGFASGDVLIASKIVAFFRRPVTTAEVPSV